MEHRVSNSQIEELLDFLSSHPNLAKGVGLGVRSKETIDRQWNHLANRLNAHGAGATKTSLRWKRYWADLKHKVKTRASQRRQNASQTGGGPPSADVLSEIDQKVLAIIGEGAVFGDPQHRVPVFPAQNIIAITPQRVHEEVIAEPDLCNVMSPEPVPHEPCTLDSPSTRGQTSTRSAESPVIRPSAVRPRISLQRHRAESPVIQSIRPSTAKRPRLSDQRYRKSNVTTRADSQWIVELEGRRVAAEEKLADAAMIIAHATRTLAEEARMVAEFTLKRIEK